jgi:hypothetical protein
MDSVRTRLKEAAISQPMTAPSKILSSVRQEFSGNVVHLNLRLYNLVSTYKDRELDAFVRGIAVNMCNLRNSRRGQNQETKRMFPSGTDISVADTQVISNCTVNQVPGTSTSFAPQYSTPSVVNRKRKGTHSSQNITNKRAKNY